jgi:predicted phage terminase large subunit-like protein
VSTLNSLLARLEANPDLLSRLSPDKLKQALPYLRRAKTLAEQDAARNDFHAYCKYIQRGQYIDGTHLRLLTKKLDEVAKGKTKRLIVCMPPRHSKSRHSSELFPSYFLGHNPRSPIMTLSHTADLSKNFGRFVRDTLASPEYRELFPHVQLRGDITAAGEWETTMGAKYFAAGVGGAIAGRGAGLLIVDDMVNDQTALQGQTRPEVFERIYDWYLLARQRLMPGGAIVVVNTRWAPNDPTGLIMSRSREEWEIITLPAIWPRPVIGEDENGQPIYDESVPERTLWPEFWKPEEIFALRAEMPPLKWEATYQQNPTAGGATVFLPHWLKEWPQEDPPKSIQEVVITIDPAFGEKERADPTGIMVSAIFSAKRGEIGGRSHDDQDDRPKTNLIVLDAIESDAMFPDLKAQVYELNQKWKPDVILIEDKASGVSLFQEMRLMGLPVQLYQVKRGTKAAPNDKVSRANAVAPIVQNGLVWIPSPDVRAWAKPLKDQLTNFPMVPNDDLTDCFVMALTYFRNFGALKLVEDYDEPDDEYDDEYRFGGYISARRRV